jgi:hypothetical protein
VAHHANVKNQEFDIDFFKQFNVVLNGLDNLDARRHVNRMCLAAGVPLVESGTTGYLGQVGTYSVSLYSNSTLPTIQWLQHVQIFSHKFLWQNYR